MDKTKEKSGDFIHKIGIFKLLLLAVIAGIIAGFGAVLFHLSMAFFHNLSFFGKLDLTYNIKIHTPASIWGVGIILIPVLGAIIVTWLVKNFAPEAKGPGVAEVMDAINNKKGIIHPRVILLKSLAASIAIGSGGSAGREGPIIQIGAAFGSLISKIVSMSSQQRIMLVAAGAGAGIAATFNTPIAGIAFAAELLLPTISATGLGVVSISTFIASYIGNYYFGTRPTFDLPISETSNLASFSLPSLSYLLFILLGILTGLFSLLFIKILYWTEDKYTALIKNDYLRHMLGMLILGLIIYDFWYFSGNYYVEGLGYATVQDLFNKVIFNPGFLLLLCFAKLLVTSLTIGSGGSGGIFSPSMFMGAILGAALASIAGIVLPSLSIDPTLFVITGIAGLVAGTTGAVITAIVMVLELTSDYQAILPVILTAALASATRVLFLPRGTIYTMKLLKHGKA